MGIRPIYFRTISGLLEKYRSETSACQFKQLLKIVGQRYQIPFYIYWT